MKANGIVSYSEAERARQIAITGRKTLECEGVYFHEMRSGFYWPIDLLRAREKVIRKVPGTLGHKMVVADAAQANSFLNIMAAYDVTEFSLESLSKERRKAVRRGLKQVEVRVLESAEELVRQGAYEVDSSFRARTQWGRALPKDEFAARLARLMSDSGMVWFGGYVDGKLAGYISISVVNRNATMGTIASHSDYLSHRVNDVLVYEMCRLAAESQCVDKLAFGLHCAKETLNAFKESMLFKRRDLPAYTHVRWPIGWGLRLLRPSVYRRLLGSAPGEQGVEHRRQHAGDRHS
jgi:hypothetical protein